MLIKDAKKITDSFTKTSKMPGLILQPAGVGVQDRLETFKSSWHALL